MGDNTRFTFNKLKHYTGVLKQQGRVDLDADWNEYDAIQKHLRQTETKDVIGRCGAPKTGGGFKIDVAPGSQDLTISPGRIYVGGILCELEATPLPFSRLASGQEVRVQNLVVDGRRFERGQWVELIPDQGKEMKLARITNVTPAEKKLTLNIAVEEHFTRLRRITTYTTQPDYPAPYLPDASKVEDRGIYLFYLDVWQRHISAIEDPDIREVALGGPDTATRTKTVWQVKHRKVGEPGNPDGVDCSQFGRNYWTPEEMSSPPVMAARAEPGAASDNLCDIPPGGGYRRLENQLYRVEIHDGGQPYVWPRPSSVEFTIVNNIDTGAKQITVQDWTFEGRPWQTGQAVELFSNATDARGRAGVLARITDVNEPQKKLTLNADISGMAGQSGLKVRRVATFKWSRDNGSVAFSIENFVSDQQVKVKRLGKDQVLGLRQGDWVEVLGDATELRGGPGTLAQITPNGIDESERQVALSVNVSAHRSEEHPKVRRWDSQGTVAVEVPTSGDGWLGLEDGVQVKFDPGSTYEIGDYWLIPARTAIGDVIGDVLWPKDDSHEPLFEARHGTGHHYCSLALVELKDNGWATPLQDCRPLFPPLTEIEVGGCCIRVAQGESIQQAIDTVIRAGGGCICLGTGVHRVNGPLRLRNAHNLAFHGESMSSVLFMNGTNSDGLGGLVLENCAHVSIESLFIVGTDVPALVDVRADSEPSHAVVLRSLTMLNATQSTHGEQPTQSPGVHCAVRLSDADDVLIGDCRLLAEVGVLCLNGDHLPEMLSVQESRTGSGERTTIDFEDLEAGREFKVGEGFTASGVEITVQRFQWSDRRTWDDGGFARVVEGDSGKEMQPNNANLSFDFGGPTSGLSLRFRDQGGNVNLEVNRDFQNRPDLSELDGHRVGGVEVSVGEGVLTLSGTIDSFAIGGQEFFIDDVTFSQGSVATTRPGVRALRMRDVQVRYQTFGAWAVTAENWLIERCDFRPLDLLIEGPPPRTEAATEEGADLRSSELFSLRRASTAVHPRISALLELGDDLLGDGLTEVEAWQLLQRIDDALSQDGHVNAGIAAIKAFLWRDCTVHTTHLQGATGLFVWWWMGGWATGNSIRAHHDFGIFAAWAHEARWNDNKLQSPGMAALAFIGSYRTRIADNHVRAATGLTNIPLLGVVGELRHHLREVSRNYAVPNADTADKEQAVLWMLLEESVRVLGLRDLKQRAQAVVDATRFKGIPVLALAAHALHGVLSNLEGRTELENSAPAPIIALLLEGNDVESSDRCISLDNFISLGGLRVAENRLHTVKGQALRLAASPYAVNVPVVIALWRAVFQVLIQRAIPSLIANVRGNADLPNTLKDALVALLEQLPTLLAEWSNRSESFLETDLIVEENTIHSLRTAIESNLFDLTIRHNHVTMQEQPVPNSDAAALVSALAESDTLRPLAVAMREGASTDIARGMNLLGDEALIDNRETRADVAETLTNIGSRVSESRAKDASINLGDAFARQNLTAVRERLPRFIEALQGVANTHGIWLKGPGGHIVGNQVMMSAGVDPDRWARGGILLWDGSNSADWLVPINVLRQIHQELDIGSEALLLLGARKTLIEGNEIGGGLGHGISVREMILGLPEALGRREQTTVDFEDLRLNSEFQGVGVSFSTSRVTITTQELRLADGPRRRGGATVTDERQAGGSGKEMRLNNINLSFDFGGLVSPELSLRYGHFPHRGNLYIEINGESRRITDNFSEIGLQVIGGVEVCRLEEKTEEGEVEKEFTQGEFTLCGTIDSFVIGGQDLWIDDVTFSRLVDTTRGVFDLKVRNNQVHDMVGAGIFLDEEALAVGVDIEGNHVKDCSGMAALAPLTDAKGGLVIRNAALCRVRGNRISHCGNGENQGDDAAPIFAIDLEAVYDLTVADNHVLQNYPNSAVALREVFGSVGIRNNDVLYSGWGFYANNNRGEQNEERLPKPLVDLLNVYMRLHRDNGRFVPSQQIHAIFLGNRLRQEVLEFSIPLWLVELDHLSFTSNHISSRVAAKPPPPPPPPLAARPGAVATVDSLALISVTSEGLLANNLLDGQVILSVDRMQRGVISGNVSPKPIQLSNSPAVQDGLNVPQVRRVP